MRAHQHAADASPLTGRKVMMIFAGFFGVIFMANLFLLFAATGTFTGAETTSAYRAGLLYNQEAARARTEAGRGWELALGARRQPDGAVRIEARMTDLQGRPISGKRLTAVLRRPVDYRADRSVELVAGGDGRYAAPVEDVPAGQWDIVVEVIEDGERAFRRQTRTVLP